MSDLTEGNIDIPLAEGTATLSPTLYAATRVSKHFGGFQAALNRVSAGELDAITAVVRFGLGIKSDADAIGLDEKVWQAGVLRLTAPITEFVLILANGGRPIGDVGGAPDTEKKDAP
jgi:hypothetical protein